MPDMADLNPAIRTNLQTHMTPQKGKEAMDLILANTGRECILPRPSTVVASSARRLQVKRALG